MSGLSPSRSGGRLAGFGPQLVAQVMPLVSDGALISAELLVKLQRAGARIKQVPVTHRPRPAGRPSGASPRVIVRAFRELFRLRRALGRA